MDVQNNTTTQKREKHPDMKWYIVHTYSQYEKRVRTLLQEMIAKNKLESYFGDIMIPVEKVVGAGKDPKRVTERKFYPGYVLIEMILNDRTWSLVKSVPKVTYFVGYKNKPVPISPVEVARIMKQQEEGATKARKSKDEFSVGDTVRVVNGPFVNFPGVVDEIKGGKLRVIIHIFNRETPVELEPSDVELSNE